MKKIVLAFIAVSVGVVSMAQTDSTRNNHADTIKVGGMVIIKKDKKGDSTHKKTVIISNSKGGKKSNSKLSTNWWILDLGFANYSDKSDYTAAAAQNFVGAGVGEDQLKLRTGKSVNVNVWLFMQKLQLIKNVAGLKYGLGVELNNYHFDDERIRLQENPTRIVLDESLKGIKKNKLAADYVTVPIMLNINFTPGRKNGFNVSGGVSGGYLYSARQKFKDNNEKNKTHDDFDLRKWKLSYIGELGLGPVRLYGSYAMNSMWEKGLDQTPYTLGIRLSRF